MYGYVTVNKAELKFREYDIYHSFYCGLCRKLKEKYGKVGQFTLSYDMTFLLMLLTGLYEPETFTKGIKCIAHPFDKKPSRINEITDYVADMSLILSYYKCKDDWIDDKKVSKLAYSKLLKYKYKKIEVDQTEKIEIIDSLLKELRNKEKVIEKDIDIMAGKFGNVMAEVFVYKKDVWENNLRKIGFYLGKFVYLMDAYEDIEEDIKNKNYNPLLPYYESLDFEEKCFKLLTMMMGECSKEFELLPIIENAEILRNIIYSGVWSHYEEIRKKRNEKQVQIDE